MKTVRTMSVLKHKNVIRNVKRKKSLSGNAAEILFVLSSTYIEWSLKGGPLKYSLSHKI